MLLSFSSKIYFTLDTETLVSKAARRAVRRSAATICEKDGLTLAAAVNVSTGWPACFDCRLASDKACVAGYAFTAAKSARGQRRNLGLTLSPSASGPEIGLALDRLLSEPQFAVAARRLRKAISADVKAERLVLEMENIVSAPEQVSRGAR